MHARTLLLTPAAILLLGCQSPMAPTATPALTPTSTPVSTPLSTSATGVEGVVADLKASGVDAKIGDPFMGEPIGGQGTSLCVGVETVQAYAFIDHEAALAASVKIDREDPSHVGNGIVEWNGPPRFWLRDRVIILYVGDSAATDAALRGLLGQPFAESREPGRGFLPTPPCQ